ncbi:16S rRNA (guanine(966)-N(2))-methyltransferase RsmD [Candidatus Tisiphia endosymbiont of Ptychoptera albimana]|uniref:16S rRNA (guanine(966)-N(2))-methyltransferase RsmD n=1 Tax=Candidatus Tisiphia endosymbiont of Ptychoptera albimana TaxID=3066260 RepID=UPI00312C6FB7
MIRIIAGKHKNRIIPTLKNSNYRPSTGKIREAIFSILTSGEFIDCRLFNNESKVLDLFAGTGSLAFESCSRGAGAVTLVDINANYLQAAKEFASKIGKLDKMTFLNINAIALPKCKNSFDLIFIDPPYGHNLVSKAVNALKKGQWLKDGSIIVVELAKNEDFSNDSLQLIKEKIYGDSKLLILKYINVL